MRGKKWIKGSAFAVILCILTLFALATAPPRDQQSLPERWFAQLALPAEHLLQALAGHDHSSSFQQSPILFGPSLQDSLRDLQYPSPESAPDAMTAASAGIVPTQYRLTYVLGVSFQFENGSATMKINKGAKHGVAQGMAVVSAEGLVGQVVSVTDYTAKVALLYDPTSRITVRRAPEGEICGVVEGDPYRKRLLLTDIPDDVALQVGDLLVTDDQGAIPGNLDVGVIDTLEGAPGERRVAWVASETDPWRRVNCFVLTEMQRLSPVIPVIGEGEPA